MRQPTAMPNGTSPIPPEVSRPVIEPQAFRKNERRRLSRVPLELPVRLRWLGPFGLETEISQTINATSGGMLILSSQKRGEGSPVWVTFPYDSGNESPEPEIPGRVARCRSVDAGMYAIGIRFERRRQLFMRYDRRQNPRVPIALLVRIMHTDCDQSGENLTRPPVLLPEETMTMDISPFGLRFCTLRVYPAEKCISISLPSGQWLEGGKRLARVLRVGGTESGSPLVQVAAEFLP
jgi:hypothetical protein